MSNHRKLKDALKRIRCAIRSAKHLTGDRFIAENLRGAEAEIDLCIDWIKYDTTKQEGEKA